MTAVQTYVELLELSNLMAMTGDCGDTAKVCWRWIGQGKLRLAEQDDRPKSVSGMTCFPSDALRPCHPGSHGAGISTAWEDYTLFGRTRKRTSQSCAG